MFTFHKFCIFSKTRFGQNLLSVGASLIVIAATAAFCLPIYHRAKQETRQSNQAEANGRAIREALGLDYTGLGVWAGDNYVDGGTGILGVKPNGPFDKAGLKQGDRIPLNLKTLKTLLIQQKGKSLVLPVRRAGRRRFNVTVSVPRFTLPYPELIPAFPILPKP